MLTREQVRLGFQLILGREPESERAVEFHQTHPNMEEFGRILRESDEFHLRVARDRLASAGRRCWVRSELSSGLSLWVDLHDDGVSAGVLRGAWEPAETNFMLSVLSPGDCVVDVGANLGWYTVTLAQAVGPNGHVFAFEPRSDIFAQLERSVQENGFADRCTLNRMALGTAEGHLNLAWSPAEMNQGHSFVVSEAAVSAPDLEHEVVRVARLDSLEIERRIRLIKIDVEGGEPSVLLGARGLIERDRPIIVAEVFPKWLRRTGNTDVKTFLNMLEDLDYRAHYLTDDGIGGELRVPVSDLNSDYVYYSVVFLGSADRLALLDGRRDGRVREIEARTMDTVHSVERLERQATLAEERAAGLTVDVKRLERQATLAEERAAGLTVDVERLTRELASAEERARAAEFRNLDLTSQLLRSVQSDSKPSEQSSEALLEARMLADRLSSDIQALHASTSWRVTVPLRAARRLLGRVGPS